MTLLEIGALRQKYYDALLALDPTKTTHSVDGESQDHDGHREKLEKQFQYYDNLYAKKQSAGRSYRINKKAL